MRPTDRDLGDLDRAVYVAIATVLVNRSEFAGLTAAARANLVLQTAHLHLAAHVAVRGSFAHLGHPRPLPRAPAEAGELVAGSLTADERVEAGRH